MPKQTPEYWTTDDVADWLSSIGLSDEASRFQSKEVDGKKLLSIDSVDELKDEYGLTSLQSKKVLRSLEKERSVARAGGGGEGREDDDDEWKADVDAENKYLRSELRDLVDQVRSLKGDVARLSASAAKSPPPAPVVYASAPAAAAPPENALAHTADFDFCTRTKISGNQTQILTVTLSPGETVRAEPGAMLHMSNWIEMHTKTGGQGFRRLLTGQTVFLTEFTYAGPPGTADEICFGPRFPGQIIPVNLNEYGGSITCQRGSLLASAPTVEVKIAFAQNFRTGFFGGEGFVLQGLRGSGYAFLNACGCVIKKILDDREKIRVSTGCLVGFESRVNYDVEVMGGVGNIFFGGEGLFVTTLTGPGTVWLESHPLDKLAADIADRVTREQEKNKGIFD